MLPTPAQESALANVLRRFFRAYRYAPISPAHGLIRRICRSLVGQHQRIRLRNGLRLEIDLASEVQQTLFWFDGDYEPQLEWAIRELLPVGATCVDCGANCGYIGLLARRFRHSPVWFIEPHPRLAETIRRNVELNGWAGSCQVIEAAASDEAGETTLFESAHKDGSHSLEANWSDASSPGARSEIRVRRDRLPGLLGDSADLRHIGLLKVDAEGHDFAVLRGLGDWLNPARIGMVYVELSEAREAGFAMLDRAGFAGFGQPVRSQRQLRRTTRNLREGRPGVLFEPLDWSHPNPAETLWLPKDGPAARHLTFLAKMGS
ncbi:MAG TPA: FkbM family methyltransferase [Verrucomicrobiota bacterium]|nr:hypothetical protein [Verrucomicrobiales bacterium]HRI11914.1 FkbM family methyltransferase [Verrucomicrobiota bacterium]